MIATHPRLGPKVAACLRRIAEAVQTEAELCRDRLDAGERPEPSPIFRALAPIVVAHLQDEVTEVLDPEILNEVLWNLARIARDRADRSWAVTADSAVIRIAVLTPGVNWTSQACDYLARTYSNRGSAKRDAAGHGAGAAIKDFDLAIQIQEDLRQALGEELWDPHFRESLAGAYTNRATPSGPPSAMAPVQRSKTMIWPSR